MASAGPVVLPAPAAYPVAGGPRFVAAGDFNGDGFADIAVLSATTAQVTVFLGNGTGGIRGPRRLPGRGLARGDGDARHEPRWPGRSRHRARRERGRHGDDRGRDGRIHGHHLSRGHDAGPRSGRPRCRHAPGRDRHRCRGGDGAHPARAGRWHAARAELVCRRRPTRECGGRRHQRRRHSRHHHRQPVRGEPHPGDGPRQCDFCRAIQGLDHPHHLPPSPPARGCRWRRQAEPAGAKGYRLHGEVPARQRQCVVRGAGGDHRRPRGPTDSCCAT